MRKYPLAIILLALPAALAASPAALAAAPIEAPTQGLPAGVAYVASVENIHEYRLGNGLQVLLFPDPSVETATVNITYFVGSRHEGYGETGMAHLLEHLMFKGTPRHPNVPDELTRHGARPNGSTWFDRTNYFETFAASAENLDWALDLEADRMVNSFIARKDLDSEMTVVRNEFESGENDPRGVLEERVYSTAYLWHSYGHSTIGARSDIEHVPIERLAAFYHAWYRPDNALLVVSGKLDLPRTLALVAQKFGPLTPPAVPVLQLYTEEPAQDGERAVTLRRVGDIQVAGVAYHIPSGAHPDYASLAVLAHILGDTPSGRLHKALVETQRAAAVSARADCFHDPGLFYMSAEARQGQSLEQVRDEMIRIAEGVAATPPTPEEIERARASLLLDWESGMRNSSRAAIQMSEYAALGDWRLLFVERDRLRAVTPEAVRDVAARYFTVSNRTAGLFLPTQQPQRSPIPATPALAAMVGDYLGGTGLTAGEEFDPSPANIEAHLTRATLPAGMKLAILSKQTRGETVNLNLQLHFGSLETLADRAVAGDLAAAMLDRGTTSRSRQQIADELDRLQANLRVFGSATGVVASLEVTRANLGPALRLLAELLRHPAFPEPEFAQLKLERVANVEEEHSDPRSLVFRRMQRHLHPYPPQDPRYVPTPEEEIKAIEGTTVDELRRFHAEFYGASAGELAVVGACDPAEVRSLAAELFGDWSNATPYARIVDRFEERPPILEAIETPDKESASFSAGLRIRLAESDPDYPAMLLAGMMTGGGFLNSRLAVRIRQQEGLSYGVGARLMAGEWESDGHFGAFAIYAPQNDARLLSAFREEIARITREGFTAEEVAQAKSGWLQQQIVSRSQNRDLARTLADREERRLTLDWDARLEQRVAEVSPQAILDAWRRTIVPEQISIVRAGDFANAAKHAAEPPPPGMRPPGTGGGP
jgi:zinc protease